MPFPRPKAIAVGATSLVGIWFFVSWEHGRTGGAVQGETGRDLAREFLRAIFGSRQAWSQSRPRSLREMRRAGMRSGKLGRRMSRTHRHAERTARRCAARSPPASSLDSCSVPDRHLPPRWGPGDSLLPHSAVPRNLLDQVGLMPLDDKAVLLADNVQVLSKLVHALRGACARREWLRMDCAFQLHYLPIWSLSQMAPRSGP